MGLTSKMAQTAFADALDLQRRPEPEQAPPVRTPKRKRGRRKRR